jgi:hypothetical protein
MNLSTTKSVVPALLSRYPCMLPSLRRAGQGRAGQGRALDGGADTGRAHGAGFGPGGEDDDLSPLTERTDDPTLSVESSPKDEILSA